MSDLPALEQRRKEAHALFSKTDAAVHDGTITKQERDAYLAHHLGSADEKQVLASIDEEVANLTDTSAPHSATLLVAGFAIFMVTLFATLFWSTGGITGAVIMDTQQLHAQYQESTTLPLLLNATTRVNVIGTAAGLGDVIISVRHDGTLYELYRYEHAGPRTAHASLERSQYEEGEAIIATATQVSSAYLMTESDAIPLDANLTIGALAPGRYTLTLIIDDNDLAQEELPFSVVAAGTPAPSEEFTSCGALCRTNLSGDADLEITITENATISLDTVELSTQQNRAPQLVQEIPDASAESVSYDLNRFFADADGDTLLYESSHPDGAMATISDGVLTVEGTPGAYTYTVYASDLQELTPSNTFTVTLVTPQVNETPVIEPEVNVTLENITQNITQENTTVEENTTETPVEVVLPENASTALNCEDPDPNKRAVDCLNANSTYFEEDVFLDNVDRLSVARVTAIGNLLIQGKVVRNDATSEPGARDFTIGYKDENFVYRPTIWIDEFGNLHLRGNLHEENANLNPPAGSYTIITRRGLYLAYADVTSGDLYLRGNVIPFRESIYE